MKKTGSTNGPSQSATGSPSAPHAPIEHAASQPVASTNPQVAGGWFRVDAPHATAPITPPAPDDFVQQASGPGHDLLTEPASLGDTVHAPIPGPPPPLAAFHDIAVQAEQLASHLRQQLNDLDRREQRLHGQLAQLDQAQRSARLFFDEQQLALDERAAQITVHEAQASARWESCRAAEEELLSRQEAFQRERRQLDEQQSQISADAERIRAELRQERILLDNRIKFQTEHLQKLQAEFEATQTTARFELQRQRTDLEDREAAYRQRRWQLDQVAAQLEARENELAAKRSQFLKSRLAFEESEQAERQRLASEKDAADRDIATRRAELQREHDLLELHAENLESRRTRLDALRTELEEANRQVLETRLAIEEAYAQLTQAVGAETAQARVEQARLLLTEDYRHNRDALRQQRLEIETAGQRVHEQLRELQNERALMAEWIAGEQARLHDAERGLSHQRLVQDEREQTWRRRLETLLEQQAEKDDAVRELRRQLTDLNRAAAAGE